MRAMTYMLGIPVLLVAVGALAWTARPATAGDEDKARIAQLEAEVARLAAESTQLREAHNAMSANAARMTRSLEALTSSVSAARTLNGALVKQRDELRGEVKRLRADIVKRPADDPARLKLALRDAQAAHANGVARLHAQLTKVNELANRRAVRATEAESALAVAKDEHAGETAALRAQLAQAEATIKQLRAAK